MTYHTEGIILKRESWRDAARLYTIFTREAGKVLAVGRGTRKSTSKLAAHLEPYTTADLLLARGRRTETVCGAVMRRSPEPFAAEEVRHAAAAFFAETLDHFVKFGERDERLWALADVFLDDLAAAPSAEIPALLAGFAWRLMSRLGYHPKLDECLHCGRPAAFTGGLFLPVRGTVVCPECRDDERSLVGAQPLDSAALGELDGFLADPAARRVRSPDAARAGFAFVEAHLDRPLRSWASLPPALIIPAAEPKVRARIQ